MIQKLTTNMGILSIILAALISGFVYFSIPSTVAAQCDVVSGSIADGAACSANDEQEATSLFGDGSIFERVANTLLFLVGAISVIMLIIGGIRYVVSAGDQNAVTGAKNTILYAIVGIVIAFLAFAAVNFVTTQLSETT